MYWKVNMRNPQLQQSHNQYGRNQSLRRIPFLDQAQTAPPTNTEEAIHPLVKATISTKPSSSSNSFMKIIEIRHLPIQWFEKGVINQPLF